MKWFYDMKIKTKLFTGFAVLALIITVAGLIAYNNMRKVNESSVLMYQETLIPLSQLQRVTATFGVIRIRIREMFTARNEKEMKSFNKSIEKEADSIKILTAMYEEKYYDDTDKKNWLEFKDSYLRYMDQIRRMAKLLSEGKKEEALEYMTVASKPLAVASRNNLDKVVDYNLANAKNLSESNEKLAMATNAIMLVTIMAAIILAGLLGYFISNIISKPISLVMERLEKLSKYDLFNLKNGAEEFSSGKLDIEIKTDPEKLEVTSKDETGRLSETINNIIDVTHSSIHSVVQVTNTVTQMVNEINKLVDAAVNGNLSQRASAENFDGGFREIFLGLNNTLDAIIGPLNMAAEYVNRISKGDIPEKITANYRGGFNELKENLNTCVDAVNLLITDAKYLSAAAVEGKLSARADADKHFGDFRKIVQGVNDTLDAVINPLNVAAGYVYRISKGDIPPRISEQYHGDFNEIKNNLNTCIDSLNALTDEMTKTTALQRQGENDAFANEIKFDGVYKTLIHGYNGGMELHISLTNDILELLRQYSEGDLSNQMRPLPGKLYIATERINQLRQNILNLIQDTNMLSRAAINGEFETRADKDAHAGDFAKIIDGINNTLDTVVEKIFWYEGLLDSIPMLLSVTDVNMKWTFINKAVESFMNVKRKDILGKHCSSWGTPICNTNDCGIAGLGRDKMQSMFEKSGMNFQVDTSNILNRKGEKTGFIEVIQNITTKVKTEEYTKNEVERLALNLRHLAGGNLELDLRTEEGDEHTLLEKANFEKINKSLSEAKNAILKLAEDAQKLSVAAVEGRLNERADLNKHPGKFRMIVEGVNNTLDSVLAPIREGVENLAKMAKGDLTVRITSEYKGDHQLIKNSLNTLAESLNNALKDVSSAIDATASASNQISSSTDEMASGANSQAQQTADVAGGVEEMTKTILENTKNATHAADAAKEAGDKAAEGGKVVLKTIEGMNKISEVVKKSAETVHALGKSSDQIGEIAQVIDDIADQTNLLALNAAIEAARAGEQGRGFAVVADEVRKLAERTTKATKEIASMIRQIQTDTANAVNSMEEGTREVERGKEMANRAGSSLNEIVNASQKVLDIIAQVAAASEEQSTTAEEISRNIEAISSASQQSEAGTHQIAQAAEDLTRLTLNLESLISKFILSADNQHGNSLSAVSERKQLNRR
jgi:methyl-accepting chemotaxis protein